MGKYPAPAPGWGDAFAPKKERKPRITREVERDGSGNIVRVLEFDNEPKAKPGWVDVFAKPKPVSVRRVVRDENGDILHSVDETP